MTELSQSESDFAALQGDIAALKRDVASLLQHLKAGAANGAQSAAASVDDSARHLYRNLAAEGERSAEAISRRVEEKPLTALLIALGVGYLAGRVLSR